MKNIYALLSLVFFFFTAFPQETPEAFRFTSMVNFGDFPTGFATGSPEISIPLVEIKTYQDFSIDLSLQYNLTGNTNNRMMGNQFGDAWNLNFAGAISREVRSTVNEVPYPITDLGKKSFDEVFFQSGNSREDGDIFSYHVRGLSGKFYLTKEGNQFKATLLESNDFVDIQVYPAVEDILIPRIDIYDKNGTRYVFNFQSDLNRNEYERREYILNYINDPKNPYIPGVTMSPSGGRLHPGFDIHNPNSNGKNYFSQIIRGQQYWGSLLLSEIISKEGIVLANITYESFGVGLPNGAWQWLNNGHTILNKHYIKNIHLSGIGDILFENHIESGNGSVLSYIKTLKIMDLRGQKIKHFEFVFEDTSLNLRGPAEGFVNGTLPPVRTLKKKLLKQIKEYNTTSDKYLSTDLFYNRKSIGSAQISDKGFIESMNCSYNIWGIRQPISDYLTLQKITYPATGSVLYQFEQNTYSLSGSDDTTEYYQRNNPDNKLRELIGLTHLPSEKTYSFEVPVGTKALYFYKDGGGSAVTADLYKDQVFLQKVKLIPPVSSEVCYPEANATNVYTHNLVPGTYTLRYSGTAPIPKVIRMFYKPDTSVSRFVYGAGNRIKRIAYFSDNKPQTYLENNETAYDAENEISYEYNGIDNNRSSSGRINHYEYILKYNDLVSHYILYEKVRVHMRNIGFKDYYYNNVSFTDWNFRFFNQQIKRIDTFNQQQQLTENSLFERSYAPVDPYYNYFGFSKEPVLLSEVMTNTLYNGGHKLLISTYNTYNEISRNLEKLLISDEHLNENFEERYTYEKYHKTYRAKEVIKFKNGDLLNRSTFTYTPENGNTQLYQLRKSEVAKEDRPLETEQEITRYDAYGNVLEYRTKEGMYVSQIWGYGHTKIVCELKNIRYTDIDQSIAAGIQSQTSLTDSSYNENTIRTHYQNLRQAHAQSMITSYTYRPMIGISSLTDTNGRTEYYEYDKFNRLSVVKDHDGNWLKAYEYHYKN